MYKLPHPKLPSLLSVTTISTPSHSHVFVHCRAVSLHKLRGSLTPAALGAFVDSCQLSQPLLALVIFSAFHSAPALPQVLLGGSWCLCRRLSIRPAPSGAGRFFSAIRRVFLASFSRPTQCSSDTLRLLRRWRFASHCFLL